MKPLLLNLCLILGLFSSCRKDQWNDCVQSTGDDITVSRPLEAFTKLYIGDKYDIVLIQDTTLPEQLTITAGRHIINQINSKIKNNTLTIENKNTCNFVRSYDRKITLEIRVRFLDDIQIYSIANIKSLDTLHFELRTVKLKNFGLGDVDLKINAGILDVQTMNSGNIFLEGFANILSCSIEEITVLDARKLLCDDIYIDSHTPLDCFVNPKNKLSVKIFNKGNVFYVSEPLVKKELTSHSGKGQLLKL